MILRLSFRRKALTSSPDVLQSLQERTAGLFTSLGGTNQANQRIKATFERAQSAGYGWMYSNSPAVRTVVDLIVRNIAQLDLRLYEEVDESRTESRPDHPAALSLRYPSETQTSDQFVRAMMQNYLVYGNAYALKFRAPGAATVTLQPLPPHRVTVFGMNLFAPDGYRIWRLDGVPLDISNPQDMLHWRNYNPEDGRLGISPLETLRNVVAEDAALQQAIIELMKAGLAGPSWVFRPDTAPEWSNDARKGFEQDLTNRLKRSNRTPPVLEEGMELRPMGVNPRDAQMLEVRKWALHQVGSMYGVGMGMLGIGEGREGDVNVAQSEFYADTLPPLCTAFCKVLELGVCRQEYHDNSLGFAFDLDEKHMGDARLTALTSASGRPVLLTNEARAMLNRPPVDGGDELVTPLNVIVGENPKPSTDVMGIQDPNKPAQDGSARLGPGQAPKPEPKPPGDPRDIEAHSLRGARGSLALMAKAQQINQLHPRRRSDIDRQRRYIDEVKAVMAAHYARQARALRQKAAEFDGERWNRELSDDLLKQISSIVEREGGIYVARLAGSDFDMRQVQHYMKAMAVGAAEAINLTTERDIEKLGLADAMTLAQNVRVSTAAASIGAGSTIFAREEAAQQAPDPAQRMKTWVADTDRHAEFDGDTVPIGEDWPAGFAPGSPPNCECTASYY